MFITRNRPLILRPFLTILLVFGIAPYGVAESEGLIEEIVVTGSYIRGTPEDAALPVDVIDAQELEDRGSPTVLDLIRAMPYVTSIVGESNQFGANQGTIGTGNVNLRGLGGMRTLVLMNGRRTTYTPAEGPAGVDTNLLPIAAIGRVEVLKDGAAAIYGSDAIAGVVNFITRRDLEGFEINAEYRSIDKSDGDWTGSINWGWQGERSNVLLSYAQQHRSELKSTERDWATPPYIRNPTGWSAFGTPGNFIPRDASGTPTAGITRDANCAALGGYPDGLPAAFGGPACRFSFVPFDNIVEETEQQQLYGEFNVEIADGVELHIEGLKSRTRLPEYRTSPSYPPTSGPNGPGAFQFSVFNDPNGPSPFSNNPGALTALQQAGLPQGVIDATEQVQLFFWRPNGWGGIPEITGGNGGQLNVNYFDMNRVGASLKGTFQEGWMQGIGWDVAVTYSDSQHRRSGVDTMITRLQAALNGLGGPDCNGIAFGQAGSTCEFFNPFSNAIDRSGPYGGVNPGYVAANDNSAEMQRWLVERWDVIQDQSLMVVDAVVNGEFGFELPGGQIGWALGGQYRKIEYQTRPTNPLIDARVTPCPIPGDSSCALATGPFIFLGQFIPQALEDDVEAVFAELAVPLLDNLDLQLAIRYEDYGGLTGDTTDPKASIRWQATEALALRGSVGSTFRGPTPVNRSLQATGLQPVPATANQYRSIDFSGNPALTPEKADTYSLGFILKLGGFRAIVDYWNYQFEDQITSVPYAAVSNAVGNGPGNGGQLANCGHPLRDLIIFDQNNTCTQGVTTANQMQRILAPVVNGSAVETAGYDISLSYKFDDIMDGALSMGLDATYVDKYDQSEFSFGGVPITPSYDAVGFANYERFPGTISEWRALANVNYNRGPYNFRWEVRFVDGVDDERPNPQIYDTAGNLVEVTWGDEVDSYYSHNLYFNWDTPWNAKLALSVVNLFDEDPSKARHQLGYDPYIGDPLGRTIELGVRVAFGGK
ncbi:MAG: TonB-dependent receptor plug domain-containing protein [bacterium]